MRTFSIIIILLISSSLHGQLNTLKRGDKWNYDYPYARTEIDSSGTTKIVYSPHIKVFQYFEGLAKVQLNNYSGFIDSNKVIVIPLIYENIYAPGFKNSRVIAEKGGRTGVIDTAGNIIIPFEYDGRIRFVDSLYYVVKEYDWGYLDMNGNVVLPIGRHIRKCPSCKITYDEILECKEAYYLKDSLEKSVNISKKEAIKIAKRKGYFWEEEFPFNPKVYLDSGQWVIKSSRRLGVTYRKGCQKTNGCTIIEDARIIINAKTGKVISKSKHKYQMANYE
jgi:hypothetical protein